MALLRMLAVSIVAASALAGCVQGATNRGSHQESGAQSKALEDLKKELHAAFVEAFSARSLNSGRPSDVPLSQYTVDVALQVVLEFHRDPHTPADLVLAGFARLAEKHPGFDFAVSGSDIVVSYRGDEVHRFLQPAEDAHPLWAKEVETSITAFIDERAAGAEPDPSAILDDFLAGFAGSLDRFANYRSREAVRRHERYLAAELARVSIGFEAVRKGLRVESISDFAVLDSRILQRGDIILSVDGHSLAGLDHSALEKQFYGPVGSTALLMVLRDGEARPLPVRIDRKQVNDVSLRARPIGNLLYVEASSLDRRTAVQLTVALNKAPDLGSTDQTGVILDLRGNPGGFLDTSVAIADVFLEDGEIVSTLGRHEASNQSIQARGNAPTNWLPLVVLVDGDTAGGAEVVASALQDLGRAVIVGQTTQGQGMVRIATRLPNGGAFFFVRSEIVSSAGYQLHKRGVLPTVCTGGAVSAGGVVEALRSGGAITNRTTRVRAIDPNDGAAIKAHRALCPPRDDGADISLEVATAILEEPGLYEQILALDERSAQTAAH